METIMMPTRIARLSRYHGYPVPWNVLRGTDGTPFFTINDDRRHCRALREKLCPLCGENLGRWKWFVGGPGSAFSPNGWYLDLPGHHDCVIFALATCPYLVSPRYLRHKDMIPNPEKLPPEARVLLDETVSPTRPEVFVAVASSGIEVNQNRVGLPYVRPQKPALGYEFWRHGSRIAPSAALVYVRQSLGDDSWQFPREVVEGTTW